MRCHSRKPSLLRPTKPRSSHKIIQDSFSIQYNISIFLSYYYFLFVISKHSGETFFDLASDMGIIFLQLVSVFRYFDSIFVHLLIQIQDSIGLYRIVVTYFFLNLCKRKAESYFCLLFLVKT